MATTPVGNPYTESSDLLANFPGQSLALANRLDFVGVNPFANAAARDAAIPSPVQGQMCSLNDDNKGYRYDGSAWVLFSGAGAANFTDTATGTYTDGGIDYKYLTLTGTGSVTIDTGGFADLLLVGGGGAAGFSISGGGGGGGHSLLTNAYLPVGTLTVTVGAGGASDVAGNESALLPYLGVGGGAGGSINNDGEYGGSGGGASGNGTVALTGGSAIGGQGFAGGNSTGTGPYQGSGGGGGGGAVGANGTGTVLGNGGAGASSSLDNVATTRSGGGGGGGYSSGTSTGGTGGGGGGTATGVGTAGTVNTGGGGGGSANLTAGGAGGSGVVIIRVAV